MSLPPPDGSPLQTLAVSDADRLAAGDPGLLEAAVGTPRRTLVAGLRGSESAKAAALAGASLAANAIALVFTVVFARLLGDEGYGSLAALVSAFLILGVGGSALQLATARETAVGRLHGGGELAATMAAWTRRLVGALIAVTVASVALREPISHVVGVPEHPWAAAAIAPTGVVWLLLSLQRGALQGTRAYAAVGSSIILEAFGRLVCGLALVGAGAGVTGAYLGTPLSMALTAAALGWVLRRSVGAGAGLHAVRTLRSLARGAWAPIAGLTLLAVLQNVDVIIVKHRLDDDAAGAYAAAAVAAKVLVWVAVGVALYLLPEAARRGAEGGDARPVLTRGLAVLAGVAVPALAVFAFAPALLLRLAFGPEYVQAADALVILGAAMCLLAVAFLTVQYMLALGDTAFLWVLGAVALTEPLVLSAGSLGMVSFATAVLVVQAVAATLVLALGLRRRRPAPAAA